MDSFHPYIKKQLLEYVKAERKKGVPLKKIEEVLLDSGHQKNILDEVFTEFKEEYSEKPVQKITDDVGDDIITQLKNAFKEFVAKSSEKEITDAKKEINESEEIVEEVIEKAEYIEEKTHYESFIFISTLVILPFIVLFTAGATSSSVTSVTLGLSPAIINIFVSFFALKIGDYVPIYMMFPLVIVSAFYVLGKFGGFPFFSRFDLEGLAIVNFALGSIFNIAMVYTRFVKPKHMRRRLKKKKPSSEKSDSLTENKNSKKKKREEDIKNLRKLIGM